MTSRLLAWAAVLGLSVGFVGQAAAAPTPAERREARKVYERAVREFNLGEYAAAADSFGAAYKIVGDPAVLFNIAQCYRLADNAEKAVFYLQAFLRDMPKAPNREAVEQRIAELQGRAKDQQSGKAKLGERAFKPGAASSPDGGAGTVGTGGSERLKPVVEIIKGSRQRFRDCFDAWGATHPGIGGKVSLTFYLDPDGAIGGVDADTVGFEAQEVNDCVENVAKSLNYPPSPSGMFTRVTYPFDFKPR